MADTMSNVTTDSQRPADRDSSVRQRVRTLLEALGVTFAGTAAFVAVALAATAALSILGWKPPEAARGLFSKVFHLGFLAVAVAFLARRPDWRAYVKVRRPTRADAGWVLFVLVALGAVSGLPDLLTGGTATGAGDAGELPPLATQPVYWPLAVAVYAGFAAPVEELLFRGIVQGRLRDAFGVVTGITLAAGCFGLMHVPIAAISTGMDPVSSFAETVVGGVVFGAAYEGSGNLVVPSVAHAAVWLSPIVASVL